MKPPIEGQLYAEVKNWHDSATGESGVNEPIRTDITQANVITSMIADKVTHHKVVIDLDLPAKLIPSSTEGHFHLYIDHEIEASTYFKLLKALVEAGLVEPGYLGASEKRGYTAVRLPWIKKEAEGDCPSKHDGFVCTRSTGHELPHQAGMGLGGVAPEWN